MNGVEVIRASFEHVHRELRQDIAELPPETLFWQPAPGVNHIGFLLWHVVRDEDLVVSHVCIPQLWAAEDWAGRTGLPASEQGTGLEPERVDSLRYDLTLFLSYAERVWARTGPALAALADADLDPPAWPGSASTVAQQLVEGCIGHTWLHLGEIRYIKGLRGWRYRE